jgi:hypothetical protein
MPAGQRTDDVPIFWFHVECAFSFCHTNGRCTDEVRTLLHRRQQQQQQNNNNNIHMR